MDGGDLELNAAKLREIVDGTLGDRSPHAETLHIPDDDRSVGRFLEAAGVDGSLRDLVDGHWWAEDARDALNDGRAARLAFHSGITEQDLEADQMSLLLRWQEWLDNHGAPCFSAIAGNPNSGKTGMAASLLDWRRRYLEDARDLELLVVGNADESLVDERVTSAHELAVTLIEADRPTAVLIDEGSTHFDARTMSRQVATQWSPLAKRMAKVGVDVVLTTVHTGKDLHPEFKRLVTLAIWKADKKTAQPFGNWPADADTPDDPLTSDPVGAVEAPPDYDPDDSAPWRWDLREGVFSLDMSWPERAEWLRDRGPDV